MAGPRPDPTGRTRDAGSRSLVPSQGMVSDPLGKLALSGLASGPYSWSAGQVSGTTTVLAGTTAEGRIVLD